MTLPRSISPGTLAALRAAAAAGLLAGCGWLPRPGIPAPPECGLPAGTPVTRVGVTPLADLGIPDVSFPGGDVPGGTVYVTREPISLGPGEEPRRMWCAVYEPPTPEGVAGAQGPLPDDWVPPP